MLQLFKSSESKEEFLTDFKDPFAKEKIESIWMSISKSIFSPYNITYSASVKFKNGNTVGEHRIDAPDFITLVKTVESFIKQL